MSRKLKIDSCWTNGRIHSGNNLDQIVEAMACANGKIIKLGENNEIIALADENTIVYDLNNKTVLPGFIDSHLHLSMFGESLETLKIRDKSKEEIIDSVKNTADILEPGEWIVGGMGWNNEVWVDPSYPTKEELDAVAPNNPVLLPRMDGHMIWVNSLAFKIANITDQTENPKQGEYLRKADGTLLGCVSNAACEALRSAIPKLTKEKRAKYLLRAQQELLSLGVTSVSDMHTAVDDFEALNELYDKGKYHLDFYGTIEAAKIKENDKLENLYKECPIIDAHNGKMTIRAIKILGDGSVGAQSAAQKEDYTDRPGHRGSVFYSDERLYEMISEAALKKMQVITHAIGDKTIDQILNVYAKVIDEQNLKDHRFRIEHFQLVSGDSLEKAKRYEVVASMQPMHAPNSASMALRRLGADRASKAYAVGLVYRYLEKIALGSDAPVSYPSPIQGIYAAITRKNALRQPRDGFFKENAIKVDEAIKGYTKWAAFAQFNEHKKGTIEINKKADFIVLSKDIFNTNDEDILEIKVEKTVIDNEIVFQQK